WRLAVEETRRLELHAELAARTPQPARSEPAAPLHRLSPLNTFVAPYADEERAAGEALDWAAGLYTRYGTPDPRQVLMVGDDRGRLRGRRIGSKRGGGSREAGLWLLRKNVVQRVRGGYRFNVDSFPTRAALDLLRD